MDNIETGDIVVYLGSDDEWNHECCKGAEYKIVKVYPSILFGVYYYDLVTTIENYDILKHDFYKEIFSVPGYQLSKINK
jgi:hypothetical protein